MALVPWSDKYKVGIRVIDNDHRELFDVVNGIAEDVQQNRGGLVIAGKLAVLVRHSVEHFPAEERFMEQAKYPGLARQVAAHERFIRTLRSFQEQCQTDPDLFDGDKVLSFLKNWLLTHVLKDDLEMVPYLRGEK